MDWKKKVFPDGSELQIMRKDHHLSDAVSSAFSGKKGNEGFLIAQNLMAYINVFDDQNVNLFLDYENFGEHHKAERGVFDFLKAIPEKAFRLNIGFSTPLQVISLPKIETSPDILEPVNPQQDYEELSFWLGNQMQRDAYDKLYELENKVLSCNNLKLKEDWLYLQASDHFFYMNTNKKVGSNYHSPHDAYINFMNVLADFSKRLGQANQSAIKNPMHVSRQMNSAPY